MVLITIYWGDWVRWHGDGTFNNRRKATPGDPKKTRQAPITTVLDIYRDQEGGPD